MKRLKLTSLVLLALAVLAFPAASTAGEKTAVGPNFNMFGQQTELANTVATLRAVGVARPLGTAWASEAGAAGWDAPGAAGSAGRTGGAGWRCGAEV